jgi:Golgi SNAP receptor complex protein 2
LTELETIATTTGTTASLNGQITASLSALNRTIEDYDNMARREIVEVHKEKAMA